MLKTYGLAVSRVEPLPPIITPARAARIAQVSEATILRLCRAGRIRGVKVGDQWRVNTAAFLDYLGLGDAPTASDVPHPAPADSAEGHEGPARRPEPEEPNPWSVDLSDLVLRRSKR